jgi:sialidase-1
VVTIYSDDGGKTWGAGEIVSIDRKRSFNESAVVELSDGRVMLNMRHPSEPHLRAVTTSADGIGGWSEIRFDEGLPEPVCMGSLVRVDERRILFSNPHVTEGRERKNLTVKLSEDDGATWPVMRTIEAGPSAYSDLAVGGDGMVYCFFERGETKANESLRMARFDLEWVRGTK